MSFEEFLKQNEERARQLFKPTDIDVKQQYRATVDKAFAVIDVVHDLFPGKYCSPPIMDRVENYIWIDGLTQKDVHRLFRGLSQFGLHKLEYRSGCNNKKQVIGRVPDLMIIGNTDIPCPSCQEKQKQASGVLGLLRSIRFLLVISNLRATLFQSILRRQFTWIGKGFNPDYSQACTVSGACSCYKKLDFQPCYASGVDCTKTNTCGCSCPAASDPNSSYTSNTCVSGLTNCSCDTVGTEQCLGTGACACNCTTGLCYYTCTPPYTWNGVACVLSAVGPKLWMTLKGRGGDARQRLNTQNTLKGLLCVDFHKTMLL
ncbi:hypothetical protein MUP77_21665 [Candidatus Bathyarchaeota archaeon]|nr:hypothetical protein [Candidatus Bathyarchaeota archaeon]